MRDKLFWAEGKRLKTQMLHGRIKADVGIVGGGFSGLTCALWLSRAGLRVAVVEAGELGRGISTYCAGIVSLTKGTLYTDVERIQGKKAAQQCGETLKSAMRSVETLVDCAGLERLEVPLYVTGSEEALVLEAEAMNRAGIDAKKHSFGNRHFGMEQALVLEHMAMIQPRLYLEYLALAACEAGASLFANSRVTSIEVQEIHTERATVQAPYLIIATGYPIVNIPGWYFLKLQQYDSVLVPLLGQGTLDGVEMRADGSMVVRPLKHGALMQHNGPWVGTKEAEANYQREAGRMGMSVAGEIYRSVECCTPDGLPYIGPYAKKTPNLFLAAGYGGMGILGSMVAAQAISARILGLPADGYEIYSGQRNAGSLRTSFEIGARYAKELLLHPSAPRCPHMGCRLVRNETTLLWECPCHGSRFDDIGHVLNAPAVHDAVLQDRR